jgi:hypothetical protein
MADTGTFVNGVNYPGAGAAGFSVGIPDDGKLNNYLAAPHFNVQYGVVAHAGGGQASATQLSGRNIQIATCASGADSVKLSSAIAGKVMFIANAGAASAQIYGNNAGDTINGTDAIATGVALANGKSAILFCPKNGVWYMITSA